MLGRVKNRCILNHIPYMYNMMHVMNKPHTNKLQPLQLKNGPHYIYCTYYRTGLATLDGIRLIVCIVSHNKSLTTFNKELALDTADCSVFIAANMNSMAL